jgi:hypothetical protein
MKRTERLALELSYFTADQLATELHEGDFCGDTSPLNLLSHEANDCSAKIAINDNHGWGQTLSQTITGWVKSLYTVDNTTYETLAEATAASQAE